MDGGCSQNVMMSSCRCVHAPNELTVVIRDAQIFTDIIVLIESVCASTGRECVATSTTIIIIIMNNLWFIDEICVVFLVAWKCCTENMLKNSVFSTDRQTHKRQCAMLLIRREINSLCSSVLCRYRSILHCTICEVSASNRRGINRKKKNRCVNDRRRNASRRKPECVTKRCEKFKLMPCRGDYSLSRCRCCVFFIRHLCFILLFARHEI